MTAPQRRTSRLPSDADLQNWNPVTGCREHWSRPSVDGLTITAGAPDKIGRVKVVSYLQGVELHVDRFDPFDATRRAQFAAAVYQKATGAPPSPDADLSSIGNMILDAAETSANADQWAPNVACLDGIDPREVSWLWSGRIPLGRITLFVGRPGEGKSFLTLDMAARVSTGTPWPDGAECERGDVLLLSAEDDPHDTIRPRLDAAYANVSKVHLLSAVHRTDDDGQKRQRLITLADVKQIEAALKGLPDCRLVVVDPVGSYLGGRTDAHRDNEVRSVLAPVAALAERYGVAVLIVAHRRKSAAGSADDTALGSRAFTGIARAVWHLSRDRENKSRRLLLPGKCNLSAEPTGLAFSICGEPPRLYWESEPVEMHADDGLAAELEAGHRKRGPEAETLHEATDWLQTALTDGPRLARDLVDEWTNGRSGSRRSLERAKQTLAVEAYRPHHRGPWWWRLHDSLDRQPDRQEKELGDLGGLSENTGNNGSIRSHNSYTAKFSLSGKEPGDLSLGSTNGTTDHGTHEGDWV